MKKPTLCVIFGGKSSEYEVSLRSAYGVISHIDREKYHVLRLGITQNGEWYIFDGKDEEILKGEWQKSKVVPVTLDLTGGGLILLGDERRTVAVDLYLPILHGEFCEDGRLQGLFDIAGAKYVGCGAFASHLCMDKILTKAVAREIGVRVAEHAIVNAKCRMQNAKWKMQNGMVNAELNVKADCDWEITLPAFVKPAMCGSSVGVARVERAEDLPLAVEAALEYGERALIEEEICGFEVEIGALEVDGDLILSHVGTVKHKGIFYDYDTKYNGENEYIIPAPLDEDVAERIRENARALYFALGCRGLARFDFFVKKNKDVVFNEVNTMPGFTEKSMFPMMFAGVGLDYAAVVDAMIKNVLG